MNSAISGGLAGLIIGAPSTVIAVLTWRNTRAAQKDTTVIETKNADTSEKAVDLSVLIASVESLKGRVGELETSVESEHEARVQAEGRASAAEGRAAVAEERATAAEERAKACEQAAKRTERRVAQLERVLDEHDMPVPPPEDD